MYLHVTRFAAGFLRLLEFVEVHARMRRGIARQRQMNAGLGAAFFGKRKTLDHTAQGTQQNVPVGEDVAADKAGVQTIAGYCAAVESTRQLATATITESLP